jgi:hypothetical protein
MLTSGRCKQHHLLSAKLPDPQNVMCFLRCCKAGAPTEAAGTSVAPRLQPSQAASLTRRTMLLEDTYMSYVSPADVPDVSKVRHSFKVP